MQKKKNSLAHQFYNLYEQKFSNLWPLLFVTFPKDSENLKVWTFNFGKWGQKYVETEWTNEEEKNIKITCMAMAILQSLWEEVFKY